MRRRENEIVRVTLEWKPIGKRPRGRPRKRWIDVVEEDLKILGVDNWRETVQDRDRWRSVAPAQNPAKDSGPLSSRTVDHWASPALLRTFLKRQEKQTKTRVSDTKLFVPLPVKIRKYSEDYLSQGFSFVMIENVPIPECVFLGEVLSNGSANEDALEASFRISYRIAKSGKNHTIGENLILPSIKDAVSCMFEKDHVNKLNGIPLLNDTVSRRIKGISNDIEETLLKYINDSQLFSIQVDESTDVAQLAVLLVIARYLKENESVEGLLLCHPLTEHTTGADICYAINSYFIEKRIMWSKRCDLSSNGGKSMSSCYSGLLTRVKAVSPLVKWTHCCIHRQALGSKPLPVDLKDILDDFCKIVNFIKSRHMNSRIFSALCKDMGSLHKTLLLHTEVRGKVFTRLFGLRHEVLMFFEGHPFRLSLKFKDHEWLQKLAYLSDIF
eukprot:XP_008178283.1 PREDICTED: zinc finger BED domain-containing protein 5-like [Acyrthosiphon pisum]